MANFQNFCNENCLLLSRLRVSQFYSLAEPSQSNTILCLSWRMSCINKNINKSILHHHFTMNPQVRLSHPSKLAWDETGQYCFHHFLMQHAYCSGIALCTWVLKVIIKLNCSWKPHSQCCYVLPSAGSLAGSPHLSELSINSQGGPTMANVTLSPNLSPDNRQASPLVSPLLNDQTGIRTDDEEEVRRKVLRLMLPLFPFC